MSSIGVITVNTHPKAIVRLNGEDISAHCYAAHDGEGWADCYKVDADGHHYWIWEDGEKISARERRFGVVDIDLSKQTKTA